MRIAEIFSSKQGEGRLTGTESCFVRFSGCNLRCWYCDTAYASWEPEGQQYSVAAVIDRVRQLSPQHVVLTGGEPMIFSELPEICRAIRESRRHITIETAGTVFQALDCDLMSISPKLSNSTPPLQRAGAWRDRHETLRHQPGVIRELIEKYDHQLKFVVDTPTDLAEIDQYLSEFPSVSPDRVWLMPQGVEPTELKQRESWLLPHCQRRGFHLCPRRHIEWYGNRRGT